MKPLARVAEQQHVIRAEVDPDPGRGFENCGLAEVVARGSEVLPNAAKNDRRAWCTFFAREPKQQSILGQWRH